LKYSTTGPGKIGLAFTEGKNWIGEWSDSSDGKFAGYVNGKKKNVFSGSILREVTLDIYMRIKIRTHSEGPIANSPFSRPDGAIYANFTTAGNGSYVMPDISLRGGYRYLTLFLVTNSTTTVELSDISLDIGFQPTWSNLQAYQGYFHSSDELLNRIWYSGAYTLQTNAVPVNTGRWVPMLAGGWANNGTLGPGDTIIVDGAKRDRAVWPGDMFIAVPSTFVSIGDLVSVKNALQTMYDNQVSTQVLVSGISV